MSKPVQLDIDEFLGRVELALSRPAAAVPLRNFYIPREPVVADVGDYSMTRQEFASECDINELMARYDAVGVWPPQNEGPGTYLDLSDVPDLQQALGIVKAAEEAFMTLPAVVRREFDNDPVAFVNFAQNPENLDQMRAWKLAPPADEGSSGTPPASAAPANAPQGAPKAPVGAVSA